MTIENRLRHDRNKSSGEYDYKMFSKITYVHTVYKHDVFTFDIKGHCLNRILLQFLMWVTDF